MSKYLLNKENRQACILKPACTYCLIKLYDRENYFQRGSNDLDKCARYALSCICTCTYMPYRYVFCADRKTIPIQDSISSGIINDSSVVSYSLGNIETRMRQSIKDISKISLLHVFQIFKIFF